MFPILIKGIISIMNALYRLTGGLPLHCSYTLLIFWLYYTASQYSMTSVTVINPAEHTMLILKGKYPRKKLRIAIIYRFININI